MARDSSKNFLAEFDVSRIPSSSLTLNTLDELSQKLRKLVRVDSSEQTDPDQVAGEDLRLRLITNGLVASRLRNVEPPWLLELDDLILAKGRLSQPAVTTPQGVSFLKVDTWMFVMPPPTNDERGVVDILNSLNDVEFDNRGIASWVFDLSGVTYVNPALIAFLIGFKQGLSAINPDLSLLWLRPEAIPDSLLGPLQRHFNLERKGSFLLSHARMNAV